MSRRWNVRHDSCHETCHSSPLGTRVTTHWNVRHNLFNESCYVAHFNVMSRVPLSDTYIIRVEMCDMTHAMRHVTPFRQSRPLCPTSMSHVSFAPLGHVYRTCWNVRHDSCHETCHSSPLGACNMTRWNVRHDLCHETGHCSPLGACNMLRRIEMCDMPRTLSHVSCASLGHVYYTCWNVRHDSCHETCHSSFLGRV